MTIALVHGVPETRAIWDPLIPHLKGDVVCLEMPGLGVPIPEGFGCEADDYLAWMVETLAGLDGPVDLVGHDWGGLITARTAMTRPDLIRSWTSDILGVFQPGYQWHDLAQSWQTEGVGEQTVGMMAMAPAPMKAAQLAGATMPQAVAEQVAEGMNETMGKAILPLYRSARQPWLEEKGEDLESLRERPGLAIIATEDAYTGGAEKAHAAAARAGAEVVEFAGQGHWWMCNIPEEGAAAINSFIAGLD